MVIEARDNSGEKRERGGGRREKKKKRKKWHDKRKIASREMEFRVSKEEARQPLFFLRSMGKTIIPFPAFLFLLSSSSVSPLTPQGGPHESFLLLWLISPAACHSFPPRPPAGREPLTDWRTSERSR